MDESRQPGIVIGQVFLAAAVFEHRLDFMTLPPSTPIGNLPFEITAQFGVPLDGRSAAVTLRVATKADPKALYRIDLMIGALVEPKGGEENMTLTEYAQASTLGLLFPFARETVANLTSRGRFGPVWLQPVNFFAGGWAVQHLEHPQGSGAVAAQPAEPAVKVRASRRKSRA